MFHLLFLLNVFYVFADITQNTSVVKGIQNNGVTPFLGTNSKLALVNRKLFKSVLFQLSLYNLVLNRTFIDKSDNVLKIPKTFYEENKRKTKIKKSPKRTIQKIIKKNKQKRKRTYVQPVTSVPTAPTMNEHVDSNAYSGQNEEKYTTEANQRKKPRKNAKVLRYHMPFQKLQPRNSMRRNRRDTERDDVFILKDLDEMEFVATDKDYNIVNAHVKNYWK